MNNKTRLDLLVFEKGFAESREKAKAVIMAGQVYVDNQKADKAGLMVSEDSVIEFRGGKNPYVSRGGFKLEKALAAFGIDLADFCCMDIGASTGGFTDCMLQNSAGRVYAVDVGYGQLAWKLRTDLRVVNIERTNIRYATAEHFPETLDFFSVDVSFISLKLVLPAVLPFLAENACGICLIKPQFEAGRENVGKKGVVRDAAVHTQVIENVMGYLRDNGLSAAGLTFSPIRGPEGNIEYLIYVTRHDEDAAIDIEQVVKAAHGEI